MLVEYGLFLAKAVTVLLFIGLLLLLLLGSRRKGGEEGQLQVKRLNEEYDQARLLMQQTTESKKEFRKLVKQQKTSEKRAAQNRSRKRVFVIDFVGNIKATAAKSLRKEVTAVLAIAKPEDEVVVCLENAGGLVHEHGFAASQLQRIRDHGVPLTVAVDKVAASGGYMMACVADKILAAPFAILGSIGVLAQLPNFHRLLDRVGVDFEEVKAGELKRTLTMFGKNTEQDRERFTQQLEETHALFKEFVEKNRPILDISKVATGEHWLGTQAFDLKLVDTIITSDDYLTTQALSADIYHVKYEKPKSVPEKVLGSAQLMSDKIWTGWWQRKLFGGD